MADDLDAELLALAGDASDEETSPPKQTADSPAPSRSRSPEVSTMGRKGTSKSSRRSRKSRKGDENGEVYVFFQAVRFFLGLHLMGSEIFRKHN